MAVLVTGAVAPQKNWFPDSSSVPFCQGLSGNLIASQFRSRYSEFVERGQLFVASNSAVATLKATLGTTPTGIILNNPAGSRVNVHVLNISIALATSPLGASTIVLAANVDVRGTLVTHTTALTIRSALIGQNGGSRAFCDSSATVPATPVVVRAVGGAQVFTTPVHTNFIADDIGGALVLSPGSTISTWSLTTAINALCSLVWAELPI